MRAAVLAALVCALALALPRPADAAPALSYGCSPPGVPTPESCAAWHTTPVKIVWDWDSLAAQPVGGNCNAQVFGEDTPSLPVSCRVQELGGGMTTTEQTVFLHIDSTPPAVTSATPDRRPDQNGWWNHAVGFSFSGSDATSGLASCDKVSFDGPGAAVVGACRDVAGNIGSRSFPFAFDATPPTLSGVKARAGNRSATLGWTASTDAVQSTVMRSPGVHGEASSRVYSGPRRRFKDTGIANGATYRYTVTVFDQAGNGSSSAVSTRPAISKGLFPRRGTRLRRAPRLRWPAVRGARYYNLQLYRRRHKLLTAWPGRTHLKLRRRGRVQGHRLRLRPGRYRWYVWPGYGSRAEHRYGSFIGQSSFVLVR